MAKKTTLKFKLAHTPTKQAELKAKIEANLKDGIPSGTKVTERDNEVVITFRTNPKI